jgi:hypothetical protein
MHNKKDGHIYVFYYTRRGFHSFSVLNFSLSKKYLWAGFITRTLEMSEHMKTHHSTEFWVPFFCCYPLSRFRELWDNLIRHVNWLGVASVSAWEFKGAVWVAYLHNIRNFPTAFTPLCPPNYLIVDEILSHYPAMRVGVNHRRKYLRMFCLWLIKTPQWLTRILSHERSIKSKEYLKAITRKTQKKLKNYHESFRIFLSAFPGKSRPIRRSEQWSYKFELKSISSPHMNLLFVCKSRIVSRPR